MQRLLIAFLFPFCALNAQVNFVSNGSFEDTVQCPDQAGNIYQAAGWYTARRSPDYFNACSSGYPGMSVPYNFVGYQPAASGVAYGGFITYSQTASTSLTNELLETQLNTTLTAGERYYISIKVSPAFSYSALGHANCVSNNAGVSLSTVPHSFWNQYPVNNSSVIHSTTIISDTTVWTTISGEFIADSNYQYLLIGNFYSDTLTSTQMMTTTGTCMSYYFVDDVWLSTDSVAGLADPLPANEFLIYPNPATSELSIDGVQKYTPYSMVNLIGQEVNSGVLVPGRNVIDVRGIAQGIYLLQANGQQYRLVILHESY